MLSRCSMIIADHTYRKKMCNCCVITILQSSWLCIKTLQWYMHSVQLYKSCITKTVHTGILPGQTLQHCKWNGRLVMDWIITMLFPSSWPSVAFSWYQYNYPEINNGGIIIPYSLARNAYTCSFSCIRLRNLLHQSQESLLDDWSMS